MSDGRVSLLFMVPGSNTVIRVNGAVRLTADTALVARFGRHGRRPRCVIVVAIAEVYAQCARALMRADLWSGAAPGPDLPSAGDIPTEMTAGGIDGRAYDAARPARARDGMWQQLASGRTVPERRRAARQTFRISGILRMIPSLRRIWGNARPVRAL